VKKYYKLAILNLNSDSFSDPKQLDLSDSLAVAKNFVDNGFDYIDIGGQSTKPHANLVSIEDELESLSAFVQNYSYSAKLSLDSYKAKVVEQIFKNHGDKFALLNDVTGLQNKDLLEVIANHIKPSTRLICMHSKGGVPPRIKSKEIPDDFYQNGLLDDMKYFWDNSIRLASQYGISSSRIILDPGLGFGKNLKHSLEIIELIPQIKAEFGLDILIGASRKSFLGLWKSNPKASLEELDRWTEEYNQLAIEAGSKYLRVH
jgi:dihydropteroate synthase